MVIVRAPSLILTLEVCITSHRGFSRSSGSAMDRALKGSQTREENRKSVMRESVTMLGWTSGERPPCTQKILSSTTCPCSMRHDTGRTGTKHDPATQHALPKWCDLPGLAALLPPAASLHRLPLYTLGPYCLAAPTSSLDPGRPSFVDRDLWVFGGQGPQECARRRMKRIQTASMQSRNGTAECQAAICTLPTCKNGIEQLPSSVKWGIRPRSHQMPDYSRIRVRSIPLGQV